MDKVIIDKTICHVIGCGSTSAYFIEVGIPEQGYLIGVNDAGKWGYHFNQLLFLNRPRHFNELENGRPRIEVIKESKFGSIICLKNLVEDWQNEFPHKSVMSLPTLIRWNNSHRYDPMTVYHSNNSPFTAMSYAATLGFATIVLWGVDFRSHKHIKPLDAVPAFSEFAQAKHNVRIFKGHKESLLNLPVWKEEL
jgi:hypothetical protein